MLIQLHQSLLLFVCLILSITLHEFGHAFVADKLGDPVPRMLRRVTLNPFAHADLFGTFILPAIMIFSPVLLGGSTGFIFGWGKPVPISLPNRNTRKRDEILISVAGPAMNLLLALLGAILFGLFLKFAVSHDVAENVLKGTTNFFMIFISLNVALMIFNLIPLPPLDGSRVLRYLVKMPEKTFDWLARHSLWIFLFLILLPSPGNSILMLVFRPIMAFIFKGLLALARFIAGGI
ncbi:MAG: site-2 protease family protein [Opitutales bacterium]|nr:site-2 protease family protein [Opitutales bacterium]